MLLEETKAMAPAILAFLKGVVDSKLEAALEQEASIEKQEELRQLLHGRFWSRSYPQLASHVHGCFRERAAN
jgi:hypothetical protein